MLTIINIVGEIILIFLYIPSGLFQIFLPETIITSPNNWKNIIFLHGWFTQYPLYYPFLKKLSKLGCAIHLPQLGWYIEDIEKTTDKLNQYIQQRQLKNIILIGHSLGGIIALNYEKKYQKIIKKVITISSPIHGAPLANILPPKQFVPADQLTPNSKFLPKLVQNKFKSKIINLRSKYDEIVLLSSCQLRNTQNIQVNVLGHIAIICSEQTISHIKDLIFD
jgi:pimeloyl-ACP methyl ester carboxylesterase